jgi:hypothetical protein
LGFSLMLSDHLKKAKSVPTSANIPLLSGMCTRLHENHDCCPVGEWRLISYTAQVTTHMHAAFKPNSSNKSSSKFQIID